MSIPAPKSIRPLTDKKNDDRSLESIDININQEYLLLGHYVDDNGNKQEIWFNGKKPSKE